MIRKEVFLALFLLMLVLAACASPTPAPPVKETVQVPVTVVVPQTVVVKETVAAPAAPTTAPAAAATPAPTQAPAAAKPQPPTAVLDIVAVPANPADPNAITTTIKVMTDTVVGAKDTTIALGTSGLTNVPLNVPVHVKVTSMDSKTTITKTVWTLDKPADSKAAIKDPAAMATEFTPDVVGAYKVYVTASNAAGAGPMAATQLHAGTFVGVTVGKCVNCHPDKVAEWAKTGHAKILTDEIDNVRSPDVATHYSESCIRCHTTGYYPGAKNGGFTDAQAATSYKFPTFAEIQKGGNVAKMPAEVKNMANVQCEDCHGPAKEHATTGATVMQSTQDEGVCNQCHNGGGHHLKGTDLKNAAHSNGDSAAFNDPIGPSRQACVRCHSGNGYATFLANPTNQAAWDNSKQTIVCSTCHDPHSDKNAFQLRITGKPIEITFDAKDVGLSATCFECHNSRTNPADAIKSSFPHYSSVAELISNTGGVDYGKTIPNSPHGLVVGVGPVANPAAATDPTAAKFLFSSVDAKTGNVPGPCVVCHMWPTIEDTKNPNYHKVGSHSFNTVSPDGKFDYTDACKSCHPTIKDDFNLTAKADYDGNGKVEGVQDEVKGLLTVLWGALKDKGLVRVDAGYPYATVPATADDHVKNAWYNYRTVYGVMWGTGTGNGNEGKAQAIHNFQRAVSLLQLSYRDLTGKDVPNATILVK